MISTLVSLVVLGSPSASAPAQTQASQLVSKMLRYYNDSQSLTGTITLTASDGAGKVQVLTTLQYSKPSLLYIHQKKLSGTPRQWLLVSDGKMFSYDAPENLPGSNRRLTESVKQILPDKFTVDSKGNRVPDFVNFDIRQIYAVGAGSLGDRSVPLDIAIGRREDLAHDNLQWVTVDINGKVKVNDVEGTSIVGKWRPYGDAANDPRQISAHYEMVISEDGKLLRYTIFQPIEGGQGSQLVLNWDVDLKVGGKPDPDLFKLK